MKQNAVKTPSTAVEAEKKPVITNRKHPIKGELLLGVATGVVAATIIETGKGIMATLTRQPLVMLSLGITGGFLVHKYRKEIISITSETAEQSKDFVLQQKENLKDLIAESLANARERNVIK